MTDPMLILAQGRMYDFRDQVAAGRLRREVRREMPRRPALDGGRLRRLWSKGRREVAVGREAATGALVPGGPVVVRLQLSDARNR